MSDLLNNAPSGIFSFSDDGILAEVNDTFCSIVRYTKHELIGKKIEELFTISTRIFYQTHFFPLLKMQGFAEEIFILIKTGDREEVPLLLNAKRITGTAPINVCSCMTLKNRRKYEDEILEAKKAAERAVNENTELIRIKKELQDNVEILDRRLANLQQRNEELRQFGHIVSHDLQEPIRKVSVFADMLREHINDAGGIELLQKLVRSYQKMRKMVLGLQQFVWLEEGENKFSDVDLNDVVQNVRRVIGEENTALHFDFEASSLPVIQGDKEQIKLMFYHLFDNAKNFRSPERRLQIQIDSSIIQHNKFNSIKDKYRYIDFVKINFIDNGIGFEQDQSNHIFQLFKKSNLVSVGLGLGLAFCKKIVDNHYGSIKATSKLGQGSVFTIMLPLKQE